MEVRAARLASAPVAQPWALTLRRCASLVSCFAGAQDFMMFVSAASKSHELLALIPLDLLNDVRSLYGLVSKRRGVLDRQVRSCR